MTFEGPLGHPDSDPSRCAPTAVAGVDYVEAPRAAEELEQIAR